MTAVEKHPQRQEIIDAILAGTSLRKITETLKPTLHIATLSRYRMVLLGRASRTLHGKSVTSSVLKDLTTPGQGGDNAKEHVRKDLQHSAKKFKERREQWIEDAWKRPVLDKEGLPIQDGEGGFVRQADHRALAAHDRNNMGSLEFEARLHGLLQDGATGPLTINAVVMMPAAPAGEEQGQVVDIKAIR